MIGTSDGQKYDSSFEHTVASTPPPGGPEKAADALNQVPRYPGSLTNSDDLGAVKSPDTLPGMQEFPKGFVYPDRNDKVPGFPTPTLDRKVLKQDISLPQPLISVLSHPDIAEAIANPKIDRTHEVPYVAGASSKPNDFTTHVDKSVPSSVTISGKTFDPAIPLNIHEQVEKHVMEQLKSKGMTDEKAYEIAHHEFAEPAEDAWYKANGISVDDANKWWAKIDKKTEQDKGDFPKDLYKAPYPHDKVEGVKHEPSGVSAEWAMGKLAGDFKPLNPMQPAYSNPGGHAKTDVITPGRATVEGIHSAALKTLSDDKVHIGTNHGEAYMNMQEAGSTTDKGFHEGFVTTHGRFVDRKEAGEIAAKANQVNPRQLYGGRLLSEHLPE